MSKTQICTLLTLAIVLAVLLVGNLALFLFDSKTSAPPQPIA